MTAPALQARHAVSSDSWTIACVDLPVPWVDELMDAVVPSCALALRWIVFSEDMSRLGALTTHWAPYAHVVAAALPERARWVHEAAMAVIEMEGVSLARCVWLQATARPVAPQGVATVLVDCMGCVEVAEAIRQIVSTAPGA